MPLTRGEAVGYDPSVRKTRSMRFGRIIDHRPTFAVRMRHLPNICQLRARCHLRLGVVVWILCDERRLSCPLIGLRVVRSPNGAHDNGDRDNEEILARNSRLVGCSRDGRSRHWLLIWLRIPRLPYQLHTCRRFTTGAAFTSALTEAGTLAIAAWISST
jgi:hypothetical protein